MLSKLNKIRFKEIYEIMEQSFPIEEYRPFKEQESLLDSEYYSIYLELNKDDDIVAFFATWNFSQFAFIEHFAVREKYRNGGIGTRLLKELLAILNKPIVLEVEPPKEEIAKKRIRFYERNSFVLNEDDYFQPPISKGRKELPLMLMTFPNKMVPTEYADIRHTLYEKVYNYQDVN